MSTHPKPDAIVGYLAADLPDDEQAALEEHLFECDACAETASELSGVALAVRGAVGQGKAIFAATEALVAQLEARGVTLRHYRMEPGARVECTVGADDVFVVAHYSADFTGVDEVTVIVTNAQGAETRRMERVAVPPGARTLRVLLRGDLLRRMPTGTNTVTLHAGDRIVAQYTLSHTAFSHG